MVCSWGCLIRASCLNLWYGGVHETQRCPPPRISWLADRSAVWCWCWLPVALLVAAIVWLAATSFAGAQQNTETFITNLDAGSESTPSEGLSERATAFITGTDASAYTITEVHIRVGASGTDRPPVAIRAYGSNGRPDALLATLTYSREYDESGNKQFVYTAPAGTVLTGGTKYFLVANEGLGLGPRLLGIFGTGGKTESSGWSVVEGSSYRRLSLGAPWNFHDVELAMRIDGIPVDVSAGSVVNNASKIWSGSVYGCVVSGGGRGNRIPSGYCGAASTGKPYAYIETEKHMVDVIDRQVLHVECGKTGSFRIRTLNFQFEGVANPSVQVIAIKGDRWHSAGPQNSSYRSNTPYILASDGVTKLSLDGDNGLPIPVTAHTSGEQVTEITFQTDRSTRTEFGFQLLASPNPNQNYTMLGGIRYFSEPRRGQYGELLAHFGPIIIVKIKNPAQDCPTALNSPSQPAAQDAVATSENSPKNNPYADLIAAVRSYAAETQNGKAHVDRWLRVLAALGINNGYKPMTATEAQNHANTYWATRWNPVVEALTQLETQPEIKPLVEPEPEEVEPVAEQEPEPEPVVEEPVPVVQIAPTSQDLINTVKSYYNHNKNNKARNYGSNWKRVLIAFGAETDPQYAPYTIAEAKNSETIWAQGWTPVRKELQRLNTPTQCVTTTLRANIQTYISETHYGQEHIDRWQKVLNTLNNTTPSITQQQAETHRNNYKPERWTPIISALKCLNAN